MEELRLPKMECYEKVGSFWKKTYESVEPSHVYEMLASYLYHKPCRRFVKQRYSHKEFIFTGITDTNHHYKIVFSVSAHF